MNNFVQFEKSNNVAKINGLLKKNSSFTVSGLTSLCKLLLLLNILKTKKIIFITSNEQIALKYQNDFRKLSDINAVLFPFQEASFYEEVDINHYKYAQQMEIMSSAQDYPLIFVPIKAILEKFPTKSFIKENSLELKLNEEIDQKAKNFMNSFEQSERYAKNYYQFFNDLENFKNESEGLTPEFPAKKEILFDKLLIIIRKFIDTYFVKAKLQTEKQIAVYKNAIDKLQARLKELNEELIANNKNNSESISKLNNVIGTEKIKQKEYENKIAMLQNEKQREKELNEKEISKLKIDNELKYKNILNEKAKIENELHAKEEQILVLKMNSEKISSLNEQKVSYLEKEMNGWKEKYNALQSDYKIKEQNLNEEISLLKSQNISLVILVFQYN